MRHDETWAAICQWLQRRGLILHIPLHGSIWFEDKITRQVVPGF